MTDQHALLLPTRAHRRAILRRVLIFVVLLLAVAACGGSNEAEPTDDTTITGDTESPAGGAESTADSDGGDTAAGSADGGAVGGGSIRAGNIVWPFSGDTCFSQGSFLQVSGSGLRVDGVPFYGSIVVSEDDDIDGDGTPDPTGTVELTFGTEDGRDAAEGEADYEATLIDSATVEVLEFEYELVDGYVRGTGEITDFNGVETDFGEYIPLEFEGGCA